MVLTGIRMQTLREALKVCEHVEVDGSKVYFMPLTRHFDSMLGITDGMMIDSEPVDTETDDGAPRRSTRQRQPNPRYDDSV